MNEIDQILANIDKESDDNLFPEPEAEPKKNDEIGKLVDSLDASGDSESTDQDSIHLIFDLATGALVSEGHEPGPAEQAVPQETPVMPDAVIYNVRGNKSWNCREPYVIRVSQDGLRKDIESLQKSFMFVDAPLAPEAIKLRIKQAIVTFMRKPNENITDRYTDFIHKNIGSIVQELSKRFKLDQASERLFIYHIGPLTVHKLIRDCFHQNKYGYCYKQLPGNKASRFFPEEFIKDIVMKWFEENIYTLDLNFDSIQLYEEMKKIAVRKYQNDLRTFNARLKQLNEKVGHDKTVSRHRLFQMKGADWFGSTDLEVYRRFLGNSIFM
ncbi:MAG: hypothetical protein JW807_12830 [Spirochaetes bacterium]|nr:hypothetical protein [Spirochaetota bacterium]